MIIGGEDDFVLKKDLEEAVRAGGLQIAPWNSSTYANTGSVSGIYTGGTYGGFGMRLGHNNAVGLGTAAPASTTFTGFFAAGDTVAFVSWSGANATITPTLATVTRLVSSF